MVDPFFRWAINTKTNDIKKADATHVDAPTYMVAFINKRLSTLIK